MCLYKLMDVPFQWKEPIQWQLDELRRATSFFSASCKNVCFGQKDSPSLLWILPACWWRSLEKGCKQLQILADGQAGLIWNGPEAGMNVHVKNEQYERFVSRQSYRKPSHAFMEFLDIHLKQQRRCCSYLWVLRTCSIDVM